MNSVSALLAGAVVVCIGVAVRAFFRWLDLFKAKHRSLHGHPRIARRLARLVAPTDYDGERFFASDTAPVDVVHQRRLGFHRLACLLRERAPTTVALSEEAEDAVSD